MRLEHRRMSSGLIVQTAREISALQWSDSLEEAYDDRHIKPKPKSAIILSPTIRRSRSGSRSMFPRRIDALEPAAARRRSAGPLHSHPVLPQALQILLLQSLHGQERLGDRGLSRRADQRERTLQPHACLSGAAASVCIFRRRHAFVHQREAACIIWSMVSIGT